MPPGALTALAPKLPAQTWGKGPPITAEGRGARALNIATEPAAVRTAARASAKDHSDQMIGKREGVQKSRK